MWVRATKPGFYNRLYDDGDDPFEIPDKLFSKNWMKRSRKPRAAKPVEVVTEAEVPEEPSVDEDAEEPEAPEDPAVDEGE